jgi:hypothetical protein
MLSLAYNKAEDVPSANGKSSNPQKGLFFIAERVTPLTTRRVEFYVAKPNSPRANSARVFPLRLATFEH